MERAGLLGNDEFGLWFVWGVALLGLDDNKGSIEKFSQAIIRTADSVDALAKGRETKLKADLADTFANRGTAYMNLGSMFLDHAEKDLQISIKLNDQYYQCYNRLGIIADHRRKYQTAITYFKQALALSPEVDLEQFDIRYNLGDAYFKLRDFTEALRQYQHLHTWAKDIMLTPEQQTKLQSLAERLNLSATRLQWLLEALKLNEAIKDIET